MKYVIIAVTSLLTIIATTGANAQNYNIPFMGNIPKYCNVYGIKEGTLSLRNGSNSIVDTSIPASFNVLCNFPIINISIGPSLIDTDTLDGESLSGLNVIPNISGDGLNLSGFNTSQTVTGVGGLDKEYTSTIELTAIDGLIDAGNYNYNLPITVTPQ
jgi:hypothetical protein